MSTVEAFIDPTSPERRAVEPALRAFCGLSEAGLQAALESVLGSVRGGARRLFAAARPVEDDRPVLAVIAGNLPALAVQPLLAALALRRPTIVKSSSSEPLFAPAFLAALTARAPELAPTLAAVTCASGTESLEAPLLAAAGRVLAYGDSTAVENLERRAPGKVTAYETKISLAAIDGSVDPARVAPGLARDVALFDQRGCLSVRAVYTSGRAAELATALAAELARLATLWPPGAVDPAAAAAVQQLRAEADLRGLHRPPLPLAAGTVVVEPLPGLLPSPGMRTVRVHPIPDLATLPELLMPWASRLQGVALAGDTALRLEPELEELGVCRFTAPGELQSPDALWHNGGLHPFAALGGGEVA